MVIFSENFTTQYSDIEKRYFLKKKSDRVEEFIEKFQIIYFLLWLFFNRLDRFNMIFTKKSYSSLKLEKNLKNQK